MKRYLYFILAICLTAVCAIGLGYSPANAAEPSAPGPYRVCIYTDGLESSDYTGAQVYYPCSISQPVGATTLTGGWTNVYSQMEWLSEHLASHGYIVLAMTPNFNLGVNRQWVQCHVAGIDTLQSETARIASPIYGKVDTGKLQIMGFSKGGGGALIASSEVGAEIASTQALAPYIDRPRIPDLSGIASPAILQVGTLDQLAWPRRVTNEYEALPSDIDRMLVIYEGADHFMWFGLETDRSAPYRVLFRKFVTSWMKVYLDGDESFRPFIEEQTGLADWRFEEANSGSGCD